MQVRNLIEFLHKGVNTMQEFDELFYRNQYAGESDAEVLSCRKGKKGYEVILSDTAFYPEGGGQPCDLGTLNGISVKDVKRLDSETIVHILDEPLETGTRVHGIIDWDRRFDHMQQHSGEHIVSGLIHKRFGYENVGFHMGEDVVTIDFDGALDWKQALEIEEKANEIIWRNEEILATFPTQEELEHLAYRSKKELKGKVRIVTIPEADVCACCGTHVARTGELGIIKLFSLVKKKSGVRIEMAAGRRAYAYLRAMQEENSKVSHLFSARPLETGKAAERIQKELIDARLSLRTFQKEKLKELYEGTPEGQKLAMVFEDGADMNDLRAFCNDLVNHKGIGIAAAFGLHEGRYAYVMISKTVNLRDMAKELNVRLQGKGGGNQEMIQGSFGASKEEIEAAMKERFS